MNNTNSSSTTPNNNERPRIIRSQSFFNIPYNNADPKQSSRNIRSQSVSYDISNPQQTPHTFRFQPSRNFRLPQQTSTNANFQKQPRNTYYCDDYDSSDSTESILSIQSIYSKMSRKNRQQQSRQLS